MFEWLSKPFEWVANTALNFVGANQARIANERAASKNASLQKEFAKHSLRWRVEDAKRAGIHPLAALGAQTHSPSPVFVGDTSVANAFSQSGQDLSRAISSSSTSDERTLQKLQIASAKASLDGQVIDNQIRASQLKRMAQVGPSFPGAANFIPGQGDSALVEVKPAERTASQPGRLAQEAGWRPDVAFSRTDTGLTPVVPESLSESLEDDIVGKLMWRLRNQLLPNLTGEGSPPPSQLPRGANTWRWNMWRQEWYPDFNPRRR